MRPIAKLSVGEENNQFLFEFANAESDIFCNDSRKKADKFYSALLEY